MPTVHTTPDLFDEAPSATPANEFATWFEAWLAEGRALGRLRCASSETVYRAMWGAFTAWCLSQRPVVRLRSVDADDLRLFLASRHGAAAADADLSERYAWRLLNLVDRVLRFAARETGAPRNAAARGLMEALPAVRHANAGQPGLPEHLPAGEAKLLVTFLSGVRPRAQGAGVVHTWQELRNRAAVALQLGGGLTPGDVRAMTLAGVVADGGRHAGVPWKLRVPADGNTPQRETPLAPWAGQLLRYWLAVRAEQAIAGPWLFPSQRNGKPWGKVAQYNAARQVLQDAEVDNLEGGSFRLRHTFALRQLKRGHPPHEVARWMGIANVDAMDRYLRVLGAPIDVV